MGAQIIRPVSLSTLRTLIERGADINAKTDTGETVLHQVVASGHLKAVQLLLKNNANANTADEAGQTALHLAADLGNSRIVQLLLDHGANSIAKTRSNETPWQWADRCNNTEVMDLLPPKSQNALEENSTHRDGPGSELKTKATTWGIIVGIDQYLSSGEAHSSDDTRWKLPRPTAGCINSALLMEQYLLHDLKADPNHIRTLIARPDIHISDAPTYENIIQAFGSITESAVRGDSVYVYFCTEGGRALTAFPTFRPGYLTDSAIFPLDVNHGGQPIRDLELHYLLRKMVLEGMTVTAVVDCDYFLSGGTESNQYTPFLGSCSFFGGLPASFDEIGTLIQREELRDPEGSKVFQRGGYTLFTCKGLSLETSYGGTHYGCLTYDLFELLRDSSVAGYSCQAICRKMNKAREWGNPYVVYGDVYRPFCMT